MDQVQLQQKIAEYYEKLPEQAKTLFAGMSWIQTLEELETKYSLNDEQIQTLGTETTLALLGIIDLSSYVETVKKEVVLEGTKTNEILDEIGQKVFVDVADILDESFNKNLEELDEEKVEEKSGYEVEIYELGAKYKLPIDKMGEIAEITGKYIEGNMPSSVYENELSLITDFPYEKIDEFIKEINEKIIKGVHDEVINKEAHKEIDGVPLPPYSKVITNDKLLIDNEKNDTNNESSLVDEVPLPPKQTEKVDNIITSKLSGNTYSNKTTKDYSLPKMNPIIDPAPQKIGLDPEKSHDPYREIIE